MRALSPDSEFGLKQTSVDGSIGSTMASSSARCSRTARKPRITSSWNQRTSGLAVEPSLSISSTISRVSLKPADSNFRLLAGEMSKMKPAVTVHQQVVMQTESEQKILMRTDQRATRSAAPTALCVRRL
jgi:hypothetical protein